MVCEVLDVVGVQAVLASSVSAVWCRRIAVSIWAACWVLGVGVAGNREWASYMRAGIDVWACFHSNEGATLLA
jgi:hypothetical protein